MQKLVLSVLLVLAFSIAAQSAIIERTIDVDFTDDLIMPDSTYGEQCWLDVPVEPFAVNAGDIVRTRINYVTPMLLTETSFHPEGIELIKANYGFDVQQVMTMVNMHTAFTLDVAGDALVTEFSDFTMVYNGLGASNSYHANLTDTFVIVNGFDIEMSISNINPPRTVDFIQMSIQASDIALVPEPATMLMLGLGGLMLRKRRDV